jgi:hypothetical protein
MLLAIADYVNEEGNAWPAVSTLAFCHFKPSRHPNFVLVFSSFNARKTGLAAKTGQQKRLRICRRNRRNRRQGPGRAAHNRIRRRSRLRIAAMNGNGINGYFQFSLCLLAFGSDYKQRLQTIVAYCLCEQEQRVSRTGPNKPPNAALDEAAKFLGVKIASPLAVACPEEGYLALNWQQRKIETSFTWRERRFLRPDGVDSPLSRARDWFGGRKNYSKRHHGQLPRNQRSGLKVTTNHLLLPSQPRKAVFLLPIAQPNFTFAGATVARKPGGAGGRPDPSGKSAISISSSGKFIPNGALPHFVAQKKALRRSLRACLDRPYSYEFAAHH